MRRHLLHEGAALQREVFGAASRRLGLPEVVIEKDAWVCWVLDVVFRDPDAVPMAFKGGTSLSKAFGAIRRFSEDVDVTLGFPDLGDELPTSRTQCDKLARRLRDRAASQVREVVAPRLARQLADEFGTGRVRLVSDEVVIVEYPSHCAPKSPYVAERVIVELGGRNRVHPVERRMLTSFVAGVDSSIDAPVATVDVLSPVRTFWEKVTLIHSACQRGVVRGGVERLARHWYDLAMLADHEIGSRAVSDRAVLDDVVRVKTALWRQPTANLELCRQGNCQLVPADDLLAVLRRDYRAMVDAGLFIGDPVQFDIVLDRLRRLERDLNGDNPAEGGAGVP